MAWQDQGWKSELRRHENHKLRKSPDAQKRIASSMHYLTGIAPVVFPLVEWQAMRKEPPWRGE
jgi:hypothetical protein